MEELLIKSKNCEGLLVQLLDGEVAMVTDHNEPGLEDNNFYADDSRFIFALYKILKAADRRGGFDHLKKEEEDDVSREEIYV